MESDNWAGVVLRWGETGRIVWRLMRCHIIPRKMGADADMFGGRQVMEIPRVDSIGASTAVSTPTPSNENDMAVREVVTAVHEVNKSELMGEGRQLKFSRDPDTHRPVIQIIDQSTGDVIDQIPPETLLQLAQQLK